MQENQRTFWNDKLIKQDIMQVVNTLKLNRMPTRKEISAFFKNDKLTNAISKRKGYYAYAKELSLSIKESETTFGKSYEAIACEYLINKDYECKRMPQNYPYDLLINDCVKIDVKVSKLYKGAYGDFYSFNLEKAHAVCDIYILYLLKDSINEIKDILIIPSHIVSNNTQISVGKEKSKYYEYSQSWNCIDKYIEFYSTLQ